jgi:hypothetical protein
MEYLMTLTNFYTAIAQLSGWLFIVASMLALGTSLTVPMIRQPMSVAGVARREERRERRRL